MIENKQLLLDAIIGRGITSYNLVTKYERLLTFTGNQWNESWQWNRNVLTKLSVEDLNKLYKEILEYAD